MNKKFGFTLAEVLITLAVLGVVAALSTPALNDSVQKSKVAPALRKFISTMTNANEHILSDADVDSISGFISTHSLNTMDDYMTYFLKYVNGANPEDARSTANYIKTYSGQLTEYADNPYAFSNSFSALAYPEIFHFQDGSSMYICLGVNSKNDATDSYGGRAGYAYFDINGFSNKPNKLGKDIFYFIIDDNGAIIPFGGKKYKQVYTDVSTDLWKIGDDQCNASVVNSGHTCAGSIADNDWRIIYKY